MKFLIAIALVAVSSAQEDGSTLRRRRVEEERKLFSLPPSFSCLTSIEGDINNNDLIACCPIPGPSDDVICTGLWCANPETLEITDANGCGCNDLKSSCDSLGMFLTNYLQAGDLCNTVNKCCDDDTTSEEFNSCMDKEEEDGLELPDAFDQIPDGLDLPLSLSEPSDAPSQDTLLQQFEMMSDMSLSLTPSSSPTTSSPTSYPTASPTEEVWQSRQLTSSAVFNYKVNESDGTFSGELVLDDEVGWMAIGFSEEGRIAGSDAVIGTEDGSVQKYYLRAKWGNAARVSRAQTLTDTSIDIVDGQTILRFTELLEDSITPGIENTFLFAYGYGGLSYHGRNRMSFTLEL